MSKQAMIDGNAAHADLINRRAKFQEKAQSCNSHAKEISAKLAALEQAHTLLERRYVCDEATISQVDASRAELQAERAKLAEVEHLSKLAAEAINDVEKELQGAATAVKEARSIYCLNQRDAIFTDIQADGKLKAKLLEALAAFANNGLVHFTTHQPTFYAEFYKKFLSALTAEEIQDSIQKFKKSNGLD